MSKKNFMSYGDAETILTEYAQGVKDVKNPQFTEAATRNNIASGESYTTIFGKIKKFFSDLKTVAFTGSYNDLDDKPTIPSTLADLNDDNTHRLVTDTEKTSWNNKCEGGNTNFKNVSIADQMDALRAGGRSGLFPFYISSANPDFSTVGYCMAIGSIQNNGVSTITAVNSQTGDIWTNGNTSQGAGAWRGWKKIDAVIDLGIISATSNNDSFGKAWDAITVYGKPVIVHWFYSGSFMALMFKYSGSQYGMAMAMKYNVTDIFTLSVNNGVKTYGDIVASGTKLGSSVSLNNYSSSTNKYTVPSDGYVMVYAGSGTGFSVNFDSVNSGTEVIKISSNDEYTRQSIFVKKGMKVYGYTIGGSSYQFYYYPLQQ